MISIDQQKVIRHYLQEHRNEIVQLTQELCSFATENPPGNHFKELAHFLDQEMRKMKLASRILEVPREYQQRVLPPETWDHPRYNVIARWDVGAPKTLHFNSHFDVVPVTDGWKTDPFQPVVKGGRLYGRGTSDMKGCIAACIFAVKALQACQIQPEWNVELSFTADEEIGGECGAGYIVKEKFVHPDAAVICEGGAGDIIMYGHRGVLWLDIRVQGVSAHGSNPGAGVNAFEKGMTLARHFQEHHFQCQNRKTKHPMDRVSAIQPSMTLGGVAGGGTKVNTIPDSFHFTIDRRLIPEEKIKEIQNEFHEIVKNAQHYDPKMKVSIKTLTAFNASITNPNSPLCQTAVKSVESVIGKKAKLRVFGAFTDLHFFTSHAQCPTIGYGVEGDGIHGCREYLNIRSLVDTAQVYATMAVSIR